MPGKTPYLLVLGGGGVGAFVAGGVVVSEDWLQPVNTAQNASANSTIRVDILFIVGVSFLKTPGTARKIFRV